LTSLTEQNESRGLENRFFDKLFRTQKSFLIVLFLFLLLRLALMAFVPVMGDEAYYFYWGMHPAGGYYDLPPMIGWWIAPFAKISLHPFWLRLPNLLSLTLLSASIYEWLAQGISKARAKLISAAFFLLPLPFLGVVMFPDIPLLFLSYFSAYLFFRATTVRTGSLVSYFFSGALIGAAVLSKYFAGFLMPAFLLWFFFRPKSERRVQGLLWFVLGGLPFAFQHLLWNETHCWANIVFNFITRQNSSDGPLYQVLGIFVLNIILVSSPFFWSAFRSKLQFDHGEDAEKIRWQNSLSQFLGIAWIVPFGIFALTALAGRGQGLHWLLFILPFFVMWSGIRLTEARLKNALQFLIPTTGFLAVVALVISIAPSILQPIFKNRLQFEFAHLTHRQEFVQAVLPDIRANDGVFTEGYTFSSILNYDLQRYARATKQKIPEISVWGSGSRFGRAFDWTSDFKALDGKRILIITPGWLPGDIWPPYFKNFKREERDFAGTHFHVTEADGFNSALYLKAEFRKPIETYYRHLGRGCSIWDLTHQ
jgi:hypothetical protein